MLEAPLWLYPEPIVSKLGVDYTDEIRNRQQTSGLNGAHYQNLLLRIKKIREKYESGWPVR